MTAKRETPRTARIWIITAVALIIVFYVVHILTRSKLPVRVGTATISDLKSTVPTNGKVEPEQNWEAHAPFPGLVQAIYVHAGDQVPAGKLLLAMDDTDAKARVQGALAALKGAQAAWQAIQSGGTQQERLSLRGELEKAKIDRDQAQHDVLALEKLETTGAAAAGEVSAAKQRLAAANSSLAILQQRQSSPYSPGDVAHARAELEDAQAAYAAAQSALSQAIVHAPFAGTVYSLPVSSTEYVQQGELLLAVADLSKLRVVAYFDEPEVGKLAIGQPAVVAWDARPNEQWRGHITRLPSTIITYGTRNVGQAMVTLDKPDGTLLPNTNVRVTVTVANVSNVLVVPRDALHIEQGEDYVYRVAGGSLHRTPITIGQLNLTDVQVVSGLKNGDQVALGATATNGQPLGDGQPVQVVQ